MQRRVSAAFGSICGAYAIRPYRIRIKKDFLMRNGLFSASLIFFSCLDARKEAKEDQVVRDASQVWLGICLEIQRRTNWKLSAILEVPGQTSSPSAEGLSFFCFFSFLKERKEGLIRESSKASGSSCLALMQEKKQKKIKTSGMPAKFGLVHIGIYPFGFELDFVFFRNRKVSSLSGQRPSLNY